jgi:acetolactate synthase-1/3 small subunit
VSAEIRHTFVVHVEDEPGALARVSSLFRRRGFNIVSLTVGATDQPGVSRMTIVVEAADSAARRIEAHIWKLVNVIRVEDITGTAAVWRELVLVKVAADADARIHVMKLADVFRARIVDVAPDSLILEVTGTEDKIEQCHDLLAPYGIKEMSRTGRIAMNRGGGGDDNDGVRRYRSAGEGKAQVGSLL